MKPIKKLQSMLINSIIAIKKAFIMLVQSVIETIILSVKGIKHLLVGIICAFAISMAHVSFGAKSGDFSGVAAFEYWGVNVWTVILALIGDTIIFTVPALFVYLIINQLKTLKQKSSKFKHWIAFGIRFAPGIVFYIALYTYGGAMIRGDIGPISNWDYRVLAKDLSYIVGIVIPTLYFAFTDLVASNKSEKQFIEDYEKKIVKIKRKHKADIEKKNHKIQEQSRQLNVLKRDHAKAIDFKNQRIAELEDKLKTLKK